MVKKFWKLSKKMGSLGWKIIEIFAALIIVLSALLLYHLHNNPVDAMKYIPEIERALFPSDSGYHLQAQKVELTSDWSRDGLIQIDIENLKVLRGDDSVVFSIPTAQFSYDLWHILTLNYLPSTVIVEHPFLEMIVDEKGALSVKTKESTSHLVDMNVFKKMLKRILNIRELNITDAHFHLQDNRFYLDWNLQKANLELKRHFHFSNTARLNATLTGEGLETRFLATAKFNRFTKMLSLEMGLDTINLKKISPFIPVLKEADLTVQLSSKAEFDVKRTHKQITDYISKVQFNAKTLNSGTLNLMDDLDNLYYVQSANINGTLGQDAKVLKIASSKIQLKDEKPVDFYLDVTGIDTFLNTGDSSQLKTILKATLYDVPTEHVPSLWPSKQGPDAHAWVRNNLSKGQLTKADFTLYFTGDELVDLFGDIHAQGVRVDYLNPMKAINDVSAQVLLYPDKVRILADKGQIDNLTLNKADLLFTDLDEEESWLQIDLDISGSVTQALEVISSKPLEFPQMFDLKPSMISGQAKALVHLSFPLLDNLKTDNVQAVVHADITQAKVNKPLEKWGLKDGNLTLDVTNEGLEIAGEIKLKNSPLHVFWHEYFTPKGTTSNYALSGLLQASDLVSLVPDLKPWVMGKLIVDLGASKNTQNLYSGTLKLDAKSAHVDLLPLSVQKESENPMILTLQFKDINEKQGQISWDVLGSLTGQKEDLKLSGGADWSDKTFHLLLTQVLAGINQFSGELNSTSEDFILTLKGKNWQAYDLTKISFPSYESSQTSKPKNILLDIQMETFALNKQKPFKEVSITGKRQGNLWQNFHAQAVASSPFVLVYEPKQKQFQGSFSDLGDLMERLNISNQFMGGKLSLMATQTKEGNIEGKIKAEETQLKETGFLLQAMTILGIVDAFRGKDIVFDEIEIPFVLTPDFQLNLDEAYAIGTNLGVTFKGKIQTSGLDLSGSVVPAYAINSLPGKIPLLGWLFRDSEAGGLINVPYTITGPLSSPEVEWNALKTVAPGALGRLF